MGKAIIQMARGTMGKSIALVGSDAADGITARDTLRDALRGNATLADAGQSAADASAADADAERKNGFLALARAAADAAVDAGFNLDGLDANASAVDFLVLETLVSRGMAADAVYTKRVGVNLPVPAHVAHGWGEGRIAQQMADILNGEPTWKDATASLRTVIAATAPETVADAVIRRMGTLRQDRSDLSAALKGGVASLAALETVADARGGMSKSDAETARKAVNAVARKAKAEKRHATADEYVAAITAALDADAVSPTQEKTPKDMLDGLLSRIRATAKKMPNTNVAARVAALEAFGMGLQLWGENASVDPVLPHGAADRLTRMGDDLVSGRAVEIADADPEVTGSCADAALIPAPKQEQEQEQEQETPAETPAETPDTAMAAAMANAKQRRNRGRRNAAAE